MIAIHTKVLSATSINGTRIKVQTQSGFSVIIPYPYDKNGPQAHFVAVQALVSKYKLDWDTTNMRYGNSLDGRGFCFCFDCSIVE